MTIRTLAHVWSPQLRNRRRVDVYLPPSYSAGRERYPVVYMQDGQNLSDPDLAFAGTWELEGTIDQLAETWDRSDRGRCPPHRRRRIAEYSPFSDRRHGGGERRRLSRFPRRHAETANRSPLSVAAGARVHLHPGFVDGRFDQPLRAAATRRGVRRCGRDERGALVRPGADLRRRLVGSAGGTCLRRRGDVRGCGDAPQRARRLARLLTRRGWRRKNGLLRYVEDTRGRHSEADWARRLPEALEFLLG